MRHRVGYMRAVYCGLAFLLLGLWAAAPPLVGAANTVNAAWAWGGNGSGALGFEDPFRVGKRPTPAQVLGAGNSDIAAVAAGDYFSLALKTDGTVWAWGENSRGELGIGSTTSTIKATQITGLSDVRAISASNQTGLALRSDGTVWSWGDNSHGQLGSGAVGGLRTTPAQIAGLSSVTAIAAGYLHSLALRADGTVWAWGDNIAGDLGNDTGVSGQYRPYPLQVAGLSGVTAIAAGQSGSMALRNDGTVWVWGWKGNGEFGDGTTSELSATQKTPRPVPGLAGVVTIAAGYGHRLAAMADGTVWAWGGNAEGEIGNGVFSTTGCGCVTTPTQVVGLGGVIALSGGSEHSLALKGDGTVWAWGRDSEDQVSGSTAICGAGQPCRVAPAQVPLLTDIQGIAAVTRHNVVVRRLTLPSYPDVLASTPYQDAIAQLAARGTIHGYEDHTFGPNDPTLRAQMAALIARGMAWDGESHTNPFTDQSGVDPDLWRNVGTLAFRGVARGYTDTATCAAAKVAPPCYLPTDNVTYVQAIAFITRAMVAQGAWQQQADDGVSYPNVPPSSGHRADLATYVHYLGAVPGTSTNTQTWSVWEQPSTRGWFAQALWLAISK
jgi:alpha-tubulin suppressor-like RCC1 family protein